LIDADPVSVSKAQKIGVDAGVGDALAPAPSGDEAVVCFNLILHHLVAATDARTRELLSAALAGWAGANVRGVRKMNTSTNLSLGKYIRQINFEITAGCCPQQVGWSPV
jgi:hypothetical protein